MKKERNIFQVKRELALHPCTVFFLFIYIIIAGIINTRFSTAIGYSMLSCSIIYSWDLLCYKNSPLIMKDRLLAMIGLPIIAYIVTYPFT